MKDPYSILGISKDATDDEVKNAYRQLARKYHPDNYSDNPLSDLAGEKMKEINDAYDAIIATRKSGRRKGANEPFNSSAASSFPEVRSLINQGRLDHAQEVLDGVPIQSRDAEWYFLNGTVLYRRGWFDQANTSFNNAVRMDPSNQEYRAALDRAQRQSRQHYNNPYRSYGGGTAGGCSGCDICSSLICADCCCECMGGDLIGCC